MNTRPIDAIVICSIVFFTICLLISTSNASERKTVERYVSDFLKLYPKRNDKAQKLMPYIKQLSKRNNVDHRIVVVMITKESSWRPNWEGGIGERGLMQVHGTCAKGQNLNTARGQVKAGIECMRLSRLACDGSDVQMVTMYASGKCKSKSERTQRLVRNRLRIARSLL